MASLWTVVVLCLFHCVFGDICEPLDAIKNCDDCMRCGGTWCKKPTTGARCGEPTDDWCQDTINIHTVDSTSSSGLSITPKYLHRSILIDESSEIIIDYLVKSNLSSPKVEVDVIDSTVKGFKDRLDFKGRLDRNSCRRKTNDFCVNVQVTAQPGFCPYNGTAKEQVTLSVKIEGISEVATAKLHIPCSCGCTVEEKHSEQCNKHGDFNSCGTCSCHDGWEGEFCDAKVSPAPPSFPSKGGNDPLNWPNLPNTPNVPWPNYPRIDGLDCRERGDINSCMDPTTNLLCSNKGVCCNGKCHCDPRLPGFLDFDEYCADLCSAISVCDACLLNPVVGEHCLPTDCPFQITMEAPDKSVIEKSIQYTWYMCNITTEGCLIDYAVMRDKQREMHAMVFKNSCGKAESAQFVYKVTVPVVIGVLAVIALLSVAAFMAYKNRLPGLPMSEPQYADIHAEDSTGINPLYKPPTSSFKNPTYGSKW